MPDPGSDAAAACAAHSATADADTTSADADACAGSAKGRRIDSPVRGRNAVAVTDCGSNRDAGELAVAGIWNGAPRRIAGARSIGNADAATNDSTVSSTLEKSSGRIRSFFLFIAALT